MVLNIRVMPWLSNYSIGRCWLCTQLVHWFGCGNVLLHAIMQTRNHYKMELFGNFAAFMHDTVCKLRIALVVVLSCETNPPKCMQHLLKMRWHKSFSCNTCELSVVTMICDLFCRFIPFPIKNTRISSQCNKRFHWPKSNQIFCFITRASFVQSFRTI